MYYAMCASVRELVCGRKEYSWYFQVQLRVCVCVCLLLDLRDLKLQLVNLPFCLNNTIYYKQKTFSFHSGRWQATYVFKYHSVLAHDDVQKRYTFFTRYAVG